MSGIPSTFIKYFKTNEFNMLENLHKPEQYSDFYFFWIT